jgi:hypothetical protein
MREFFNAGFKKLHVNVYIFLTHAEALPEIFSRNNSALPETLFKKPQFGNAIFFSILKQ